MRALVLVLLLVGCIDTRPTCEVACANQARCALTPSAETCTPMCTSRFAASTMDCRLATDAYNRCWASAGSCPASTATAAPGCSSEFDDQALACSGSGPMPLLQSGI